MPAMMRAFNFTSVKKKRYADSTSKQNFSNFIPVFLLFAGGVSVVIAVIAIVY